MAQSRYYSATAQPTVLVNTITPGQTSIQVQQVIGFPVSVPYILALDYGTPSEEVVLVTAQVGTSLTVTRAYDGTSGTNHNSGAAVRHTWSAIDGTDSRIHEGSTSGVHGVTGNVVGTTDTQTLTNKTLTSPTINGAILASPVISGTVTGGASYTAPTLTSPTITGTVGGSASYTSPTITGTVGGSASYTSPTLTGTVGGSATYTTPTDRDSTHTNSAIGVTPLLANAIAGTTADLELVQLNGSTRRRLSALGVNEIRPQATATDGYLANAVTGFTGDLIDLQVNSVSQLQVDQAGNITNTGNIDVAGTLTSGTSNAFTINATGGLKSTGFLSSYGENTTATASLTNTAYAAATPAFSITVVVPPSGLVEVYGHVHYESNAAHFTFSDFNVSGSVSGVIKAPADGLSVMGGTTGSYIQTSAGKTMRITSANIGETLTITWQHKTDTAGGSYTIYSRSLGATPLIG